MYLVHSCVYVGCHCNHSNGCSDLRGYGDTLNGAHHKHTGTF